MYYLLSGTADALPTFWKTTSGDPGCPHLTSSLLVDLLGTVSNCAARFSGTAHALPADTLVSPVARLDAPSTCAQTELIPGGGLSACSWLYKHTQSNMFDTLSSAARFPPMYSNPPTYATPTLEQIGMVAESDNIYAQFYAAPTPEYIGMVAESDNYAQVYAAPTPEHIGTVAESDFDISDFYAQTYTTPTREHIGMVAGSDFDFSNFTPHDDAADCHSVSVLAISWPSSVLTTDFYTQPCFSNLNLFTSEGVPLSQNILYPPLPTVLPPWLIDENFPTSSLMLDMPFVQAAEQSALLFPPAVPGASSIQPQITSVPPDDDARWSYRYQDFSETGLTPTGDQHSSVQLIPPSPPAPSTPPSLIKIPQRDYDYGRKQKSFKPLEPIIFSTNNSPGMNLGDALHKDFKGLDGRDEPMLQGTRGAISCRLLVSLSRLLPLK